MDVLKGWLEERIRDAATLTEHGRRMTITVNDVIRAMKIRGITFYGFDVQPTDPLLAAVSNCAT